MCQQRLLAVAWSCELLAYHLCEKDSRPFGATVQPVMLPFLQHQHSMCANACHMHSGHPDHLRFACYHPGSGNAVVHARVCVCAPGLHMYIQRVASNLDHACAVGGTCLQLCGPAMLSCVLHLLLAHNSSNAGCTSYSWLGHNAMFWFSACCQLKTRMRRELHARLGVDHSSTPHAVHIRVVWWSCPCARACACNFIPAVRGCIPTLPNTLALCWADVPASCGLPDLLQWCHQSQGCSACVCAVWAFCYNAPCPMTALWVHAQLHMLLF